MRSDRRGAARSRAGRRRCAGSRPRSPASRSPRLPRPRCSCGAATQLEDATAPTPVATTTVTVPVPTNRAGLDAPRRSARDRALDDDVTADLAREAARTSAAYAATADALVKQLAEPRAGWAESRREHFDARLSELRAAVASADEGHTRQRALRAEIRYLQGALIRDEVASNDRMLAAPGGLP